MTCVICIMPRVMLIYVSALDTVKLSSADFPCKISSVEIVF
jgi:hypothetical protein